MNKLCENKIAEFDQMYDNFKRVVPGSYTKIIQLMFVVLSLTAISGALMYFVEGTAGGFTSITKSIYWTITTFVTVGYGDIIPQTDIGRTIHFFIRILGISTPTIIIASAFVFLFKKLNNCLQGSSETFRNKGAKNK